MEDLQDILEDAYDNLFHARCRLEDIDTETLSKYINRFDDYIADIFDSIDSLQKLIGKRKDVINGI